MTLATGGPLPTVSLRMAPEVQKLIFDPVRLERLAQLGRLLPKSAGLAKTEVLFTSWEGPHLTGEALANMPRLRAVFHCAGSVKPIVSEDFWDRGIPIVSAAAANAIPVAQYTLAAIVLANKGGFDGYNRVPSGGVGWVNDPAIGNLDRTIGIVGFSQIGRRVVELLNHLGGFRVLVVDPFVDAATIAAAGAHLVTLEEMLPQVDVLSIHAPNLPETRHMIGPAQLAVLPDGVTVINTSRGALLDHDALVGQARAGRLKAVLDVTDPEPLPADSPVLATSGITVTPHIAGALGTERRRLADFCIDQFEAFLAGRPMQGEVHRSDIARIA